MPAEIRTVAIMTPGDMGQGVGALLRHGGLRVITCLEGRSARTRALAKAAGIEAVPDDATLVREADALLSILVPSKAVELAERMGGALRERGGDLLYVDCNAVAPQTARQIAEVVEAAGARFVDAGIIGPPPRPGASGTRFYASGADVGIFAQLRDHGLNVRPVGDEPGQASAVKMCYAALTKGTCALMTELSVAAERLGASKALREEFAFSQPHHLEWMRQWVVNMVPKAHRWVGEMEEIARTFDAQGLTPRTFEGVADLYRYVADTPLAQTSPEAWSRTDRSYEDIVAALADARLRDN
jgi:3-hydroxyisobutyrate dehydrogenase-like beta-hydroxyacid dehydrogenase